MSKTLKRVSLIALCLMLTIAFAPGGVSFAEQYPSKDIQCLIGYPPGGSIDALARLVAKYAPQYLGVDLKVINKPGGSGGEIAMNALVSAKPDGYTIAHVEIGNTIMVPGLRPEGQLGYKTEEINHIATLSKIPTALFVAPDSPFNSLKDIVAYSEKNPGKLTCATSGAFTLTDASRLLVQNVTGAKLKRVVFKGGGEMRVAVAGGHVDMMASNAFFTVQAQGTLKALGVAGEKPFSLAPDVPTYRSQGIDILDFITRGFAAPLNVPEERLAYLEKGFEKMCRDPKFLAEMNKIGYSVDFLGREATNSLVRETVLQYQDIISAFKAEIATQVEK